MNDKFGQFDWKCWKDEKPDSDKYVYTYFPDHAENEEVDIQIAEDVNWDDEDYWCYVFIPDAPKVEKNMTLEDRFDRLESRIEKLLEELRL